MYGAKVIGLGVGPTNQIDIEAFDILTGRRDRHFILKFKKDNNCGGDDDSDSDSDGDDDSDSDDDDDDDGGCVSTELKEAVRLICG